MDRKVKNRLLIGGFILTLFICYHLAIANTIALKSEYNRLEKEQKLFTNTPKQIALLKQKQHYYDSLLKTYKIGETSMQNNLLKVITSFAEKNKLKVINFLAPHEYKTASLQINTYSFTIEGRFNTILQLLYTLEQQTRYGEIISVHYEKKKNYRTRKYFLQARVLLKNRS